MFLFHFRCRAEGEWNERLPGDTHLDCKNSASEQLSLCAKTQFSLSLYTLFAASRPKGGSVCVRSAQLLFSEQANFLSQSGAKQ